MIRQQFKIGDSSKVLIVEDDQVERQAWFRKRLPNATLVRNPLIAVLALMARDFDLVFLDFDLPCPQYRNGLEVARSLAQTGFTGSVVIHSANAIGALCIAEILQRASIRFVRAEYSTFQINEPEPNVIDLGEID
jgi:CheY-like chemotaxis protein